MALEKHAKQSCNGSSHLCLMKLIDEVFFSGSLLAMKCDLNNLVSLSKHETKLADNWLNQV